MATPQFCLIRLRQPLGVPLKHLIALFRQLRTNEGQYLADGTPHHCSGHRQPTVRAKVGINQVEIVPLIPVDAVQQVNLGVEAAILETLHRTVGQELRRVGGAKELATGHGHAVDGRLQNVQLLLLHAGLHLFKSAQHAQTVDFVG
ncbi:hypothetical protein TYRP_009137 [Tyrophagus putrescentiae]|nr:hypothetical protein TYRP_009137 [Tyrophagus putrescentiae]